MCLEVSFDEEIMQISLFFFFFFMATTAEYRSSQARDWIHEAALAKITAAAQPDPLTQYAGLGIEPEPLQVLELPQSGS